METFGSFVYEQSNSLKNKKERKRAFKTLLRQALEFDECLFVVPNFLFPNSKISTRVTWPWPAFFFFFNYCL